MNNFRRIFLRSKSVFASLGAASVAVGGSGLWSALPINSSLPAQDHKGDSKTDSSTSMSINENGVTQKWDDNWDCRDPWTLAKNKAEKRALTEQQFDELIAKNTPSAVRNIFLVRHGQYFDEADESELRKLTQLGREQAEFLGKRFTEAKQRFNFDKCVFSTLIRARETGEIVMKQMPHLKLECSLDSMLEEGAPYPPEPTHGSWRPKYHKFHQDGARIEAAFRKYFHRAKPSQKEDSFELIVCHANVIRYFVCRALQYPPEGWLRISLANSSITWLQIYPNGRVVLKAMGDFGHLPPEKLSFS